MSPKVPVAECPLPEAHGDPFLLCPRCEWADPGLPDQDVNPWMQARQEYPGDTHVAAIQRQAFVDGWHAHKTQEAS